VKIAGDVKSTDFPTRVVKSGASVESARPATAAARLAAENRRAEQRLAAGGGVAPSTNGHRVSGTVSTTRTARVGGDAEA
jgi:hypothetical protein